MANPLGPAHPHLQRSPEPSRPDAPGDRGGAGGKPTQQRPDGRADTPHPSSPRPSGTRTGAANDTHPSALPRAGAAKSGGTQAAHARDTRDTDHAHREGHKKAGQQAGGPPHWTPTPSSLGLSLPATGIGLGRPLMQGDRTLPGLPSSGRDLERNAATSGAGRARRHAGSGAFERLFGEVRPPSLTEPSLGVNPAALLPWRLPQVAATLTLPLPTPMGASSAMLRVRLQRPQPAPRPAAIAVAVAAVPRGDRPEAETPPAGPAASSTAPQPGMRPQATAPAAAASGPSEAAAPVRAAASVRTPWAGLDAPRPAQLQQGLQPKRRGQGAQAEQKARSKLRFKAFERAAAYTRKAAAQETEESTDGERPGEPYPRS